MWLVHCFCGFVSKPFQKNRRSTDYVVNSGEPQRHDSIRNATLFLIGLFGASPWSLWQLRGKGVAPISDGLSRTTIMTHYPPRILLFLKYMFGTLHLTYCPLETRHSLSSRFQPAHRVLAKVNVITIVAAWESILLPSSRPKEATFPISSLGPLAVGTRQMQARKVRFKWYVVPARHQVHRIVYYRPSWLNLERHHY